MAHGSSVEPGIYAADSNDDGDPISNYERTLNGTGLFGLDLETKGIPSNVFDEPVRPATGSELESAPNDLPE
jgi:hypothetical protein